MPMLYGEGERAFIRLQEEIMRSRVTTAEFAWRSTEGHGEILATSPSAFTNSGNIIPTNTSNASSSPPTLSSGGIRLSLRFISNDQQGLGLAILYCREVGKREDAIRNSADRCIPNKARFRERAKLDARTKGSGGH